MIADESALADGPSPQSGKVDSPVSPLLSQFIQQRERATPEESQQPADGAFVRSQPGAGPEAKDSVEAQSPGASGADYEPVRFDSSGNVQVYINLTDTDDGTLQQLRDLGANIEVVNSRWNKLQAWVPVDALDRIAELDSVRYITPPDYASTKAGSVVTEGDGILRADLVRNLGGLTGKGVRVGVISDGVDSWCTASASGDLPGSLQINPNVSRSGDEGTALLEIVHDLAPDAQLAFSSATSSLVMAEAILWLANNAFGGEGVDIIVDDLNIKDAFFEDGPVAQAAQDAVDGGVVFVSAAGNDAGRHYEADFVDAGDGFHAFDGDSDTSLRVFGASAGAILQWNDPFGASGNDYDMYMCPPGLRPDKFNLQNRICNASDRTQDGDDDPVEGVYLLDRSGFTDIYIRKFSGDDRRLELFLEYQFGTIQEHGVPAGSVISQAAAAGVLAVGAIPADDPGHDDPQSFSARGPSIFIDPDDNEKTVSRNKPDVMGIDSVLITGAGGFGFPLSGDRGSFFPGTSAAAPHVAGIAALVMEAQRLADPDMTKKEVADAVAQTIRDTAFDLGDPGYDGTFGYGRADAFAAVESIADFELYSKEPFTFEFTVNSTGDGADSSTTDATCDDGSGNCTLRAAIEQANALSSGVIMFNISGTGTQTISPASALPTITKPVFIDGYSQSGASAGTLLIELDGASAGTDANGLTLSGEGSVVRGLVVNGFEGNGIVLEGSSGGQFLEGNHIGTNVDGSVDDGNGSAGVYVNGAPDVLLRDNVISGNDSHGVHVSGSGASWVVLQGNTIGLNAAGAADLGNSSAGVHIDGAPDALLSMNTISGNDSHGISVSGAGASGAEISGNTIGLNAAGDASVGNTGSGVHISGAEDAIVAANSISGNGSHGVALTGADTEDTLVNVNYIGTNDSGDSMGNGGSGVHIGDSSLNNSVEGNTIANNSGDGVTVVSSGSTGNTIRKNSIHTNTGHGIDLGDDGATANDTDDADTGPNSLRNYPTDITFAVRDDAASSRFKIDSSRSQEYIVDFYGCDSSSSGEGKEWLGFSEFRAGSTDTTTRTVGSLRGELEEYSAPAGTHVTATVTELQTDSTSEFAPCVEIVDLPKLDLSVNQVEVTEDSTTETTYSIALASQPSDTVRVWIAVQFSDRSNVVNPNPGSAYYIHFTTMNWSEPVSVTVFGVTDDDALHESNEIQHRVSIGDGNHLVAILPVFVTDDEAPGTATLTSTTSGVTFPAGVSAWQEYDGILELDEGDIFTYTVELDEEPEGDVAVETFYVGGDALTVSPASITFTETGEAADADKWEWDDPRTVTLTALHDFDAFNEFRTIRHRVEVGSEDYVVAQLSVEIRDLALSGLAFDPADLAVTVDEGGTATYTVALASDPGDGDTATVEISVESGPFDNAIYVSPDDLTFTGGASGNWSTPQTVTVTGRNDDDEFDDLPEIEHILKVGSKTALGRNVEVTVIDGNRAPYFLEGTHTTRRVFESAGQDDEIGDPVEALDLNASDTLTYSLEDTSGKFSIDSGTGQIKVAADGALDYETATFHEFDVIVKDDGGLSDKIDFTVLVRNVDEPLEVTGDATPTFNENNNINNAVARYTARDPEGTPVTFTWSLEGTDGSDFSIDTSGNVKFTSQPDYETQDEYSITVVATDTSDSFNRGELGVTVTVTDVNEAPEIIGSGSETYQENQTHPVTTFGFTDREGDDVAWMLAGTDRGDFTITKTSTGGGQLQFASTPDFERPVDSGSNNIYNLTVVATDDGTPAQVDRLDVTVTVEDVNEAPSTPTGNASITVAENTSGNLARYSSSDPERRTIQWSVTGTDAGAFRIDSSGNLAFDGAPDYENARDSGRNNVYAIAITASDDGNLADGTSSSQGRLSASFNVTVTVTPVDEPPVVTGATTFNNWQENDGGIIETYTATDPEGDASIAWSLGGPDRGDFTIAGGVLEFDSTPDYERPADSGGNNEYNVTVQATDSNSNRGDHAVTVTVNDVNETPTVPTGNASITVAENSTGTLARYSSSDPEGRTIQWSVTGTDAGAFRIDSSGNLAFYGAPDYENARDSGSNNVYDIAVTASDDGNLADGTISSRGSLSASFSGVNLKVTPVDEPPVITGATTFDNWQENDGAVIETYTAIDPEGNTPITWTLGGTDRGDFTIAGGVLEFAATPDFENPVDSGGNNHYEVIVEATDSNNKRSTHHVDVIVKNVDEPPVISGPDTVDDNPENSAINRQVGRYSATDPEGATVTLSLTGTDDDEFTLASNGVLTFKESPDYETPGGDSYDVTVSAVAGSHTVDKLVTVNIQNIEEPGTVTLSTVQPQVGTSLTATLQDDDVATGITWQWYQTSSRGSSGTAITNADSATYTPGSGDVGRYLRAVASYDDGFSDGNTAAAVSANRVQVVTPGNEAPEFPAAGDYDRNIRENQPPQALGAPVTASDPNSDRLTYTIGDSDLFEIDQSTGQLRTKAELDHENRATHTIRVSAIDPSGADDDVDVTITVEDVDETPTVSGPARPEFAENGTGPVATYNATDPDDTGVDLVLAGTDSDAFTLSSGDLTFNEVPDYEQKSQYRVTIEAREISPGTSVGRLSVTVQVMNVDEPSTVEASVREPRVGQLLRLNVKDDDGGESVREWKWERGEPNSPCGTVDSPLVSNWELIASATGSSYTPTAADQGHCIRVTAIYDDRAGTGRSEQFLTPESVEFGPFFSQGPPTFTVRENSAADTTVGSRVTARHSNSGETLTYSLTGGDTNYFTIETSTGQLRTSTIPVDYESLPGPVAVVEVTAADNNGEQDTITVNITVTDECRTSGEPPCVPSVSAPSATSLSVSWSAPTADSHDLRYRESGSGDPWTEILDAGSGRSHTITQLTTGTPYEVQVRTVNGGTPSPWSPSGTGTPRTPPPPPLLEKEEEEEEEATTTTGTGGGGAGGFVGGGFALPLAPARSTAAAALQAAADLFRPLAANRSLVRVWRLVPQSQVWLFYDPAPPLAPFNTLRRVNLDSDPPTVAAINMTRSQTFRGIPLFAGWNYVPLTSEPPPPRTGTDRQAVDGLFQPLIANGSLGRVWWFDSRSQAWRVFDPEPQLAPFNTLRQIDLATYPPPVVSVSVTSRQQFRGRTLYPGLNYVVLD